MSLPDCRISLGVNYRRYRETVAREIPSILPMSEALIPLRLSSLALASAAASTLRAFHRGGYLLGVVPRETRNCAPAPAASLA